MGPRQGAVQSGLERPPDQRAAFLGEARRPCVTRRASSGCRRHMTRPARASLAHRSGDGPAVTRITGAVAPAWTWWRRPAGPATWLVLAHTCKQLLLHVLLARVGNHLPQPREARPPGRSAPGAVFFVGSLVLVVLFVFLRAAPSAPGQRDSERPSIERRQEPAHDVTDVAAIEVHRRIQGAHLRVAHAAGEP